MGILRHMLSSTWEGVGWMLFPSPAGSQQTLDCLQFLSFGAPKSGSPAKALGDRHTQGNRYNTLNYVHIFTTGSTKRITGSAQRFIYLLSLAVLIHREEEYKPKGK